MSSWAAVCSPWTMRTGAVIPGEFRELRELVGVLLGELQRHREPSVLVTLDDGVERVGAIAGRARSEGLSLAQIVDRVLEAASAVDHLDDVAVLAVRRRPS